MWLQISVFLFMNKPFFNADVVACTAHPRFYNIFLICECRYRFFVMILMFMSADSIDFTMILTSLSACSIVSIMNSDPAMQMCDFPMKLVFFAGFGKSSSQSLIFEVKPSCLEWICLSLHFAIMANYSAPGLAAADHFSGFASSLVGNLISVCTRCFTPLQRSCRCFCTHF